MSEKKGFFGRLKSGLSKTRDSFVSGMNAVFSGFSEIDDPAVHPAGQWSYHRGTYLFLPAA